MAPKGARLIGGLAAVQARAPVLGGQFAVWGGIFASCDCTLTYYRQKVCKRVNYDDKEENFAIAVTGSSLKEGFYFLFSMLALHVFCNCA